MSDLDEGGSTSYLDLKDHTQVGSHPSPKNSIRTMAQINHAFWIAVLRVDLFLLFSLIPRRNGRRIFLSFSKQLKLSQRFSGKLRCRQHRVLSPWSTSDRNLAATMMSRAIPSIPPSEMLPSRFDFLGQVSGRNIAHHFPCYGSPVHSKRRICTCLQIVPGLPPCSQSYMHGWSQSRVLSLAVLFPDIFLPVFPSLACT